MITTNSLIDSIKRRAMLPENQITLQTEDFLAFINEEIQIGIIPTILMFHEEYFVVPEEIELQANTINYSIPYRAIGGKIRDLFYQDQQGNRHRMSRISPENQSIFQTSNNISDNYLYYIQGNDIVLLSNMSNPIGSLIVTYYLKPNKLVEEERVGEITSIAVGGSTTIFTLDTFPTGMSTTTELDILEFKSGYRTRKFDILPANVNSSLKTITFNNSDLPTGIEVGDFIAFAEETIVPQIPEELYSMLAQRVAARCLEAMGDQAGLQAANIKLAEMENKTSTLIDNRVDGSPLKVTNYNGLLRSTIRGRWWRR